MARELCHFLLEKKLYDIYSNMYIALRMLLSMPAINGERLFSTLKKVKLTIHAEILKKNSIRENY